MTLFKSCCRRIQKDRILAVLYAAIVTHFSAVGKLSQLHVRIPTVTVKLFAIRKHLLQQNQSLYNTKFNWQKNHFEHQTLSHT